MSIGGYILTGIGAAVGTTLFEVGCHRLFGVKRTKIHPSQDPGYQSRIRWCEYVQKWF